MNVLDFDRWLDDQPGDVPLGDRSWMHNPLANYCHDNGILTLPMPPWGLRFVNLLPRGIDLTRPIVRHVIALALTSPAKVAA